MGGAANIQEAPAKAEAVARRRDRSNAGLSFVRGSLISWLSKPVRRQTRKSCYGGSGPPALSRVARPTMICCITNGLAIMMLLGTPIEGQSAAPSPLM